MKLETVRKTAAIYLLILLLAAVVGSTAVYQDLTLTEWWKPLLLGALPAAALSGWAWRGAQWLTGWRNYALNYALAMGTLTAVADGTLHMVNYFGSDTATRREVTATVVEKRTKVRHRVRRLARHVTTRGEKYTTYYLLLDIPQYGLLETSARTDLYNRTRKGGHVILDIERGKLGFDVVKDKRAGARPRNSLRQHITPEMRRILMPADH